MISVRYTVCWVCWCVCGASQLLSGASQFRHGDLPVFLGVFFYTLSHRNLVCIRGALLFLAICSADFYSGFRLMIDWLV